MRGLTSNNEGFSFNRIKWHLLLWFSYLFFYVIVLGSLETEHSVFQQLKIELIRLPIKLIATYTLIYFFIPRFLLRRQYYSFFLSVMPVAFVLGLLQRYIDYHTFYQELWPDYVIEYPWLYWPKVLYGSIGVYTIAAIAAIIKLLKQWFTTQQINNSLRQEKLAAELKFLKAQIHPHFLFNTLNNLYALTLKKSSKAPEVVLKLSDLLDYMLYECNVPKVGLDKEIAMLENYIELEKIRYGDDLKVDFKVDNASKSVLISPMLLLPLIENAFKHGVSGEINSKWLNINLETNNGNLEFSIENSKDPKSQNKKESYTEGIGLKNVIRRLELVYKDVHQLQVNDKGESFKVVLNVEIEN
ncbi:MAG: histidine kinase [Bacteroidales bacterium]|nr:histidine kinase [Bacteroidales bacterium]